MRHSARPALAVLQEQQGLLWVAMITSAENRPWLSDDAIEILEPTGLPVSSSV